MLQAILAVAMLTGDASADPAEITVLRPQIIAVALANEIADPREAGFLLAQDPVGDLDTLRRRWKEFADAPLVGECERFPDRQCIADHLAMNRAWRNRITELVAVNSLWREDVAAEVGRLDLDYQVWDNARDSRCEHYYITVRREALRTLRTLIGAENFYGGRLP